MADVKKFNGYTAIDGTAHSSLKAALAHTTDVKVRAALTGMFASLAPDDAEEVVRIISIGGVSKSVVVDIPRFLMENREAIQEAYAHKALLRTPRGSGKAEATA
jgi:hypothetical protein